MFIVWGTKVVRAARGRMADFCRLCRDFRAHRVAEVQSVGHIYYIPLGRRKRHGFEKTCEACGLNHSTTPEAGPPALSRDRHADLEQLLAETNPQARLVWADRLAFEQRARSGVLTPEERRAALVEPLLLTNSMLESRTATTQFDGASSVGCVGTIVAGIVVGIVAREVVRASSDSAAVAALAVAGVLAVFTLILLATDGRRYTRRVLLPIVVRSLRPLQPSEEEIETTLGDLKSRGVKIGKTLKPSQVVDALSFAFA
jgi:hypothetical protein